jgi:release factor glutamine methyltransferase
LNRGNALREGREKLCQAGFDEASLEAELLLRHVLKLSRAGLYSSFDESVSPGDFNCYLELLSRRLTHEPLAYITGNREFYGLDFYVDSSVLIPRPETEMLVEEAIRIGLQLDSPLICDVGTGSGAIAVSVARNIPEAKIYAVDINQNCIEIARKNALYHGVERQITFIHGDLLSSLPQRVDIVVANLPYVKHGDVESVAGEPLVALDGGASGLDVIERMIGQMRYHLNNGGSCLLEIGEGQHTEIVGMIRKQLPAATIKTTRDFNGIERMVTVTLPLVNP